MTANRNTEFDFFITDLNGNLRGKRIPSTAMEKVMKEGVKLPRSVVGFDFWGLTFLITGWFLKPGTAMEFVCQ